MLCFAALRTCDASDTAVMLGSQLAEDKNELKRVLSELQILDKGAQEVAGQKAVKKDLREHLDGTINDLKAQSKSVSRPCA